jgi:hypothetical protein
MLLLDEFLRKTEISRNNLLKKGADRFVASGSEAVMQAARRGEHMYFAPSTMRMLLEKLKNYEALAQEVSQFLQTQDIDRIMESAGYGYQRGFWLEFDKPLSLPLPRGVQMTSALLGFVPSDYIATGQDTPHLYLIDTFGDISEALKAPNLKSQWRYEDLFHQCPRCQHDFGVLVPCKDCQIFLTMWGRILAVSMLIGGQYLAARRYEEKAFEGVRRVPRQHNEKKVKKVPVKHIFKVIDANELIIQVPLPDAPRRDPTGESWLADALAAGQVEYQEIQTRPFTRTYRHERYTNVRGQTVTFAEGISRMQPRLKENIGKHVTKVKASLYENGEPHE